MNHSQNRKYEDYKKIFKNVQKPFAFIDLNYLNENIDSVLKRTQNKKKIRLATKSIRCAYLLNYILKKSDQFCGLMTYDANETIYLLSQGFDNILLGYPIVDPAYIEKICLEIKNGKNVCFMVDMKEHIQILQNIAQKHNLKVPVCLDIDMSQEYPFLYFGVYRSALKTKKRINEICQVLKSCSNVKLTGIMGYEAQVAGVCDNEKSNIIKNYVVRFLKSISIKKSLQLRKECVDIIHQNGFQLNFVNGGGSGSIESTTQDPAVTEITVGSAFYAPSFLDDFYQFKLMPAAGFAIEITRQPYPNVFTAHGGGYNASGPTKNKEPKPYLPTGLHLTTFEAVGEVQTPLLNKGNTTLKIGDPVLMRHAKAGEMLERFNQVYLIKNDGIEHIVNSYRGDGLCTL